MKEQPSEEILEKSDIAAKKLCEALFEMMNDTPVGDAVNIAHFSISMLIAGYLHSLDDNLTQSQKEKAITHIAEMALEMISIEIDETVEIVA